MRGWRVWLVAMGLGLGLLGQEVLTNDSIIRLVKAGLGEALVLDMVKSQPGRFALGEADLQALKAAGVSEKILAAMVLKTAAAPAGQGTVGSSAETAAAAGLPSLAEVGVYYKKGGQWMEVLPEVVNWRTGGVLKNIASGGIVKKDINGHVPGANSRNSVASPMEFLIYAPEGVAITEYQLLRLRQNTKSGYREFRTVTGGVFNQKSGAMRDMVPFEGKKVGNRLYSVVLPTTLGAGEYGFLQMGATGTAGGLTSLSMGKMYTFRLLE